MDRSDLDRRRLDLRRQRQRQRQLRLDTYHQLRNPGGDLFRDPLLDRYHQFRISQLRNPGGDLFRDPLRDPNFDPFFDEWPGRHRDPRCPYPPRFSRAKGFGHRLDAPSCLPPPDASLQTRIKWWEQVLTWLRDLVDAMEESLNKELDDLSALKHARDKRNASYALLRLDLVQMPASPRPPVVDGYAADSLQYEAKRPSRESYEKLTSWGRWEQQQQDLRTCQLKKLFYGPQSLPNNIVSPSYNDMVEISAFVEAHEHYLFKFWEHLEHLLDLVGNTLIPQVENKLESLRDELEWKELDVWLPERSYFEGGFAPNQPITDNLSDPEPEDDYPNETKVKKDFPDATSLSSGDNSSNPNCVI